MCLVMIVVMIESTGMFLALSDMTERPIDEAALTKGLRADGVGTIIGGVFNTFPYTSFSQNVGLVGVTGVRSRWVTRHGRRHHAAARLAAEDGRSGRIGAGRRAGRRRARHVRHGRRHRRAHPGRRRLPHNRHNLFVVALSIGFGMIPLVAPNFFKQLPHELHPLLESGILLAAIAAVVLNLFFNGVRQQQRGARGGGRHHPRRRSVRLERAESKA